MQLNLKILTRTRPIKPDGQGVQLRRGVQEARPDALQAGPLRADDGSRRTWWPADSATTGRFFIRMAWHSAGTYRIGDGRGGAGAGTQRFAPLNSWPDNAQPRQGAAAALAGQAEVRQQDLLGRPDRSSPATVALESMGLKTFGFGGGRADIWEPDEDIYWGAEDEVARRQALQRRARAANPLAAVQMGLIYVNPEGPNGNPDPLALGARHPRDLCAHGDERRGDRRADRRRPHLRQVATARATPSMSGPSPRAPHRGAGPRLEEQLRQRQWRRHHHQRPRRRVDADADEVGQRATSKPVRLRVGADEEPGRCAPVDAQGRRGRRTRCRMRTIRPSATRR